jgi:hypothetical protein
MDHRNPEERAMSQAFCESTINASMRELVVLSDEELAHWQSLKEIGSGAHILAEKEWERRLSERALQATIRATEEAARLSGRRTIEGAVVGAALTALVGWLLK